MKLLKKILSRSSRDRPHRSRFEQFEFSTDRFECTLSSLTHAGACEDLFLDTFSPDAILELMNRAGLAEHLRRNGFTKPVLEIKKTDGGLHGLKIYYDKPAPERLLIEIRLSRITYMPEERHVSGVIKERRFNVIAVEWLALQNPKLSFTSGRPRLPGQTFPGLGCIQFVITLMEMFAGDLGIEAIVDVPEHFHAAVMYSKRFKFMDPAREGMMRGVLRDLGAHTLSDLSWGFITGTIRNVRTGEPVMFEPSEQVLPLAESLSRYFASREYLKRVENTMNSDRYELDYDRMLIERKKNPDYKNNK
jgi:hypothetical protein